MREGYGAQATEKRRLRKKERRGSKDTTEQRR
jgi:hypothetical protein